MELELCTRNCPVCGASDNFTVVEEAHFDTTAWDAYAFASRKPPEYMHFRLLLCGTCSVLYASPIPTLEALASAYHDAAYDSSEESHFAATTYADSLSHVLGGFPDRVGALDIGTGDGAFLEQLLALGFTEVLGVEPSAAPIAAASPTVRPLIQHGLFHKDAFRAGQFRLITCFQTIEHLYEPMGICQDAYHLLRTDGVFFLVCHNREGFVNRLLGSKSPIFDIEHLQLFSPKSVTTLLERAGFRAIAVRPIINRYPLRYWMRLFPLPKSLKDPLGRSLSRGFPGSVPIPAPVGNLAVIGYK